MGGPESGAGGAVWLFDEATREVIGRISEAELAFLRSALEEECPHDRDYWIQPETIEALERRRGATPRLIGLLRSALRGRDGIELLFWREDEPLQELRRRLAPPPREEL